MKISIKQLQHRSPHTGQTETLNREKDVGNRQEIQTKTSKSRQRLTAFCRHPWLKRAFFTRSSRADSEPTQHKPQTLNFKPSAQYLWETLKQRGIPGLALFNSVEVKDGLIDPSSCFLSLFYSPHQLLGLRTLKRNKQVPARIGTVVAAAAIAHLLLHLLLQLVLQLLLEQLLQLLQHLLL